MGTALSASEDQDMSQALPFAPRPKLLDGTLAGDVGFDPFGFGGPDKESLISMREAEVKHARLASALNGGLDNIEPDYWVIVACVAGLAELSSSEAKEEKGKEYTPGDCGFDPLNLMPENKADRLAMQTKELKHGRIAMLAVLGYAAQEFFFSSPVTAETP